MWVCWCGMTGRPSLKFSGVLTIERVFIRLSAYTDLRVKQSENFSHDVWNRSIFLFCKSGVSNCITLYPCAKTIILSMPIFQNTKYVNKPKSQICQYVEVQNMPTFQNLKYANMPKSQNNCMSLMVCARDTIKVCAMHITLLYFAPGPVIAVR
jgi:hypothetical protein